MNPFTVKEKHRIGQQTGSWHLIFKNFIGLLELEKLLYFHLCSPGK